MVQAGFFYREIGNGRKPFRFLWNQSQALASNLCLLLYPRGPLRTAFRAEPQLAGAVFEALRQIDTGAFLREGRVYGGGLYKMEPKELRRLGAEPVVEAMGKWKPTAEGAVRGAMNRAVRRHIYNVPLSLP